MSDKNYDFIDFIREKFGNMTACADALNWSKQRLLWSLQNPKKLKIETAEHIMAIVGAPDNLGERFFYARQVK